MKILEVTNGSTSSTKQFIWDDDKISESRDASSNPFRQYFRRGQVNFSGGTGTSYFYAKDHIGSIRELTDVGGNVQSRYSYDAYGNVTKIGGTGPDSDFLFDSYYYHAPSGLNLTLHRYYSPGLARWLSRDPIGDLSVNAFLIQHGGTIAQRTGGLKVGMPELLAGIGLYEFIRNYPVGNIDLFGLDCCDDAPPLPSHGPGSPCQNYGPSSFLNVSEQCVCFRQMKIEHPRQTNFEHRFGIIHALSSLRCVS